MTDAKLSDLLGRTMTAVENRDNEEIVFTVSDGAEYMLHHYQDCCESVRVEDVTGNLADLVDSPITMADEASFANETPIGHNPPPYPDSYTWTFYRFATVKGYVTIRFLGESNGYYSERVDFVQTEAPSVSPTPTTDE